MHFVIKRDLCPANVQYQLKKRTMVNNIWSGIVLHAWPTIFLFFWQLALVSKNMLLQLGGFFTGCTKAVNMHNLVFAWVVFNAGLALALNLKKNGSTKATLFSPEKEIKNPAFFFRTTS